MSISDDIRSQQARATKLTAEVSDDAKDLRRRVSGLEWQAGAGDTFRHVVEGFAADLERCSDHISDLATDLGRHADAVDAHESTIHSALHIASFGLIS